VPALSHPIFLASEAPSGIDSTTHVDPQLRVPIARSAVSELAGRASRCPARDTGCFVQQADKIVTGHERAAVHLGANISSVVDRPDLAHHSGFWAGLRL
jgi:hypothetical protein